MRNELARALYEHDAQPTERAQEEYFLLPTWETLNLEEKSAAYCMADMIIQGFIKERDLPMKGNNELRINAAEMIEAMQHYLDNVLLKAKVKVTSVSTSRNPEGMFVVTFREPEKTSSKGPAL